MSFFSLLYFIKILIPDAVDLKLDYQLVLQQLYTISRELQLKVYNHEEGKEHTFIGGGGEEVARAVVNTDSMAFQRLSPGHERRGMFLLPLGLCYHHRVSELSLLVS